VYLVSSPLSETILKPPGPGQHFVGQDKTIKQ
jgi:hypothetical protein